MIIAAPWLLILQEPPSPRLLRSPVLQPPLLPAPSVCKGEPAPRFIMGFLSLSLTGVLFLMSLTNDVSSEYPLRPPMEQNLLVGLLASHNSARPFPQPLPSSTISQSNVGVSTSSQHGPRGSLQASKSPPHSEFAPSLGVFAWVLNSVSQFNGFLLIQSYGLAPSMKHPQKAYPRGALPTP